MIFDYSQVEMPGGVITYPEYVVEAQPLDPGQIKETIYLRGTTSNQILVLGGTVDDQE